MSFVNEIKSGEKLITSIDIKIEIPDESYEDTGYNFINCDEVDVGREFKSEFSAIEKDGPLSLDNGSSVTLNGDAKPLKEKKKEEAKEENPGTNYFKPTDVKCKLTYCTKCDKTYKYSSKSSNLCKACNSVLQYKCARCLRYYFSIVSLQGHLYKYCSKKPRFSCHHCEFKAIRKYNLASHIQSKHLPRKLNCTNCGKGYSSVSGLWAHSKTCGRPDHSKRFSCAHCDYSTDSKFAITNHIHSKHLHLVNSDLSKCSKCGKGYRWLSDMRRHFRECGQTREFKRSLMRFSCDKCPYKCRYNKDLNKHVAARHMPRDLNAYKCEGCGKSYSHKTTLHRHLRVCGQTKGLEKVRIEWKIHSEK